MLLKHQKSMLKFIEKIEKTNLINKDNYQIKTKIGIYADPNGSGKTCTMINLIKNDKMNWPLETLYDKKSTVIKSGGLIKMVTRKKFTRIKASLIVLASGLIPFWQDELSKYNLVFTVINTKKDVSTLDIVNNDIIIVNTNIYNLLVSIYSQYVWKRFIFDEPSYIKIPNMKFVEAGFYWLITARPNSLCVYGKTVKHGMMKTILGDNWWNLDLDLSDIIFKNNTELLNSSFVLQKPINITHNCKVDILINEISKHKLSGKIVDYTNNPNKFWKSEKCSICLSEIKLPTLNKECNHIFCAECIYNWFKISNNCPLCKEIINKQTLTHVLDFNTTDDKNDNILTKKEIILDIARDSNKKILLWVDSNVICNNSYYYNYLKSNNINCHNFEGSVSVKLSIINNFKQNITNILIMNSNEDIPGLNLQEVTDIILASATKSEYNNAINKVNRIGINHPINVHYFNVLG